MIRQEAEWPELSTWCQTTCGFVRLLVRWWEGNTEPCSAAQEMEDQCQATGQSLVFVVDRFYSSTLAYTLGQALATDQEVQLLARDQPELFCWPKDLARPVLQLTLEVEEEVRRIRVQARNAGEPPKSNNWDDRLAEDPGLGRRISLILQKVGVDQVLLEVGTLGKEKVLEMARMEVERHIKLQSQHCETQSQSQS